MRIVVKHGRALGALILAGFTAACAGDAAEQLFVQPGKFDYFSCPELVAERQKSAQREHELKTLIDRAEKESVGVLVAAASYRGEYLRVQAEQKMQTEVMDRKKCPPDTQPQASSSSRSSSRSQRRH